LNEDIQATFPKIFWRNCDDECTACERKSDYHHKVKDYAAWRAGYNVHEKSRLSAGLTNGKVFRSAEDPNDIVILQDVADVAKARTWLGSDDLKASMQKSGVIGSPSIRFAVAA
jgi:hypothetical protein